MKKLSIIAAAAAIAASTAAPVAAQDANDPFVSTAGLGVSPLILIAGVAAVVVAVASSSGTD